MPEIVDITPEPEESQPRAHADPNTAKTSTYYKDWDKVAGDALAEAEVEDAAEKKVSDAALGLDKDGPKSAAEKADIEKRGALKEAKKNWDGVEARQNEQKMIIENEKGQPERALTFEGDLTGKRVLVLKDNVDCTYELPADLDKHSLIKLFISGCERCKFILHCNLMTSLVELCHCTDCTIEVKHPTNTFQIDLSENITLWFGQNVLTPGHKIYSAGNRGFQIDFDWLGNGKCLSQSIDNFAMSKLPVQQAAEQQFVTQLTNLSKTDTAEEGFATELVVRDAGLHPTTEREVEDRKDEIRESLRKRGIADEAFIEKSVGRLDAPSALVIALNHKDEGNKAFKERHYVQASVYYLQAIDALTGPDETKKKKSEKAERDDCLVACLSNRAACQLKLGHHESALEDAEKLLVLQPEHVKGLFRKGLALHAMKRYREACPALGKALSLAPKNDQIKAALQFAERHAAKPPPRSAN